MTNLEVAWLLNEIADLLEIKGENIYKIRAYRKGAKAIKNFSGDLLFLSKQKKLQTIPGVGKSIAEKITEIVETGTSKYLEELQREIPPGLRKMMRIPGLGPKSVSVIYKHLGITSLEELERAARSRQIRNLPRMGSKTELAILRGIDLLKRDYGKTPIGTALPIAKFFKEQLESLPEVKKIEIAGSLRRGKEIVGDIDLIVATEKPETVIDVFTKNPQVKEVIAQGTKKSSVFTWTGVQVDLRAVEPDSFYTALHHFTGSQEHNLALREHGKNIGIKINEYGLFTTEKLFMFNDDVEEKLQVSSEKDIYKILQMQYIPPELREDNGEIELALRGELPNLVEKKDIKGDLHIHTNWSDGVNSIEEIVELAEKKEYQYIAITDHSRNLKIAGGLSVEKLLKQQEIIKQINKFQKKIKIFSGSEVDILPDGRLDYPDEILQKLDLVIASVHTHMKQDEEEMTERVIKAIQNPNVDILAHPTGRILGRREPFKINIEKILKAASENNIALEINASPDRLDLNDEYVKMAKELGIMIVINTDAHDPLRLEDIEYGIKVARRAGLEREDILNCLSVNEVEEWLKNRKLHG
ncbi:MAG: polymerase [Clostridia bacterium]|jgi:DNA polymerase (family 10)|nr:polymerase [Clostridia bacterium]